jgi:hypothetical protein
MKMNKWGHKKILSFNCREGPYKFVGYVDGNGDERGRICIIEDAYEH